MVQQFVVKDVKNMSRCSECYYLLDDMEKFKIGDKKLGSTIVTVMNHKSHKIGMGIDLGGLDYNLVCTTCGTTKKISTKGTTNQVIGVDQGGGTRFDIHESFIEKVLSKNWTFYEDTRSAKRKVISSFNKNMAKKYQHLIEQILEFEYRNQKIDKIQITYESKSQNDDKVVTFYKDLDAKRW